jgi:insulysin
MKITSEIEILEIPKKSPSDKKDYKLIKLPNGLKALLVKNLQNEKVCDDETVMKDSTSAVALCVDVGSFDDPFEVQGLAHFLEHMV